MSYEVDDDNILIFRVRKCERFGHYTMTPLKRGIQAGCTKMFLLNLIAIINPSLTVPAILSLLV